ncbi:MAG: DUF1524 domain-containing protein, partial [Synergistaceae bacterium]|nr:DUF1524 domain-containing protein [Synergistaceae bacterium]
SFFDILDNRYKSIGMNSGAIIRLMYVLTGNPTKASEDMQDEAKFIADNRKRIEKTLEALKKFLDFSNHTSWFEASGRSVIPLYFLAYYIFYQPCSDDELTYLFDNFDTNNSNFREMSEWLKLSLLNHAFSYGYGWRANTTGMTQIHKIMENYKGKNFPSSQLYLLYSERLRNFINKRRITAKNLASLDEEYLFNMIYGWPKSSKRNEDIDHIHPRSILESAGISPSSIDSIGNLQLLNPDDNRHSKRAKEFGDWLNSEKGPLDKTAYLSMHIIPDEPSLWYSDKFAEFLQKRLEMIAAKIKSSL